MSSGRRDVSVPQFAPIPNEIQKNLEDAIAGFSPPMHLSTDADVAGGHQSPQVVKETQSSSKTPQSDPPAPASTTDDPKARAVSTLLDKQHKVYHMQKAAEHEVEQSASRPFVNLDGKASKLVLAADHKYTVPPVPSTSGQRDLVTELEQNYQDMVSGSTSKPDANTSATTATAWATLPVPYLITHIGTAEQFLCSKGEECVGNPVDYKVNGEPVKIRAGRYGGKNAASKMKEAERGRNLKLCADCYLAMKAGPKR